MSQGGSQEDSDGTSASIRLGSYKTYRVEMPFRVIAHDEEQVRRRWDQFVRFLDYLTGEWGTAHELVKYVQPEHAAAVVTFVEETEVFDSDLLDSGPANDPDYLLEWIDPHADADYDPYRAAQRAYFAEDSEDEAGTC